MRLKYANGNLPQTEEEKKELILEIAHQYEKVLDAMKMDWRNDPNSSDTPMRFAKAWVNDIAAGCYTEPPKITAFSNIDGYDGIVFQGEIQVTSLCSHHHAPFLGKAYVAYIPSVKGKVIGLSKLNRVVDFYSRRPQVQENLTMQIHKHIDEVCEQNLGVAVLIEAKHTCCSSRGIKHDSTMKTVKLSGEFYNDPKTREEFFMLLRQRG